MHISHLWGAAALCAGISLLYVSGGSADPNGGNTATPPPATGHFVFVIEGDRDRLNVTHASHKADPWAGVQKGLQSDWTLTVRDDAGTELVAMPLDMSKFDLDPARKGKPLQVQGCVVSDSRVAMLANVPCFATAATYVFTRGEVEVGTIEANAVNQLAGGGR